MIERYICKNGLRIVLEKVPSVRSVTIGVWVLAGSRNENKLNNGISHFLEHMMFKGTKKRSAQDIAEAFDAIGGHVNAFTSKEYTCYYARVLDSHKEYALEVLADMFFHSTFQADEMEREKKVILEEIKMYEDSPDDYVHDLLAEASFGHHAFGYPILGTEENLQRFTKETIYQYMDQYYTAENTVISIAGNVDASFIPVVEQYFDQFQSNTEQRTIESKLPRFSSEEIIKHKDTEQAHLCLGYKGLPLSDDRSYSLVIMNNILGGSMSSRLFQNIREKEGLAYSVYSYHSSYLDQGLLTIYAGTSKQQLNRLKDSLMETIDLFVTEGITEKELQNSKEQLKGNLVLSLESTNSRMSRNGKNELLLKRHRSLNRLIQEIDAVTIDSIRSAIDYVFSEEPSLALVAPV